MAILPSGLGWEIGPGSKRDYSFSFGLNGKQTNLTIAKRVLSKSPELRYWEFHAGKPPKKWDFKFLMYNTIGHSVMIDASKWRYSLVAFNNGEFYDISILAPEILRLDENAKLQAIHIVLDSVLGEEIALTKFDRIELKSPFSENEYESSSAIQDLREHLLYLDS
jgi:hypothetical protein